MKTPIITVHPEFPELDKIAHCAKIIRQGGLVIFPTETVYGIAADYNNPRAVERLREVKRREEGKPFAVLLSQKDLISNYTASTDTAIYKCADAFWPGPMTLVVPSKHGGGTLGVRMPDHPIALRLAQESQCTLAAPSANRGGESPSSTVMEALKELDGLVDAAIDGGPARLGKASTVVDLTSGQPALLREGALSFEDVKRTASRKTILFVCTGNSCRSVMAEYLLRQMLGDRDDVEVLSAGTGVFLRSTASAETLTILQQEGIDASRHLSQPVTSLLLKKSDLILVMTRAHRSQVLERVPEVEKRVYLLREFAEGSVSSMTDMDIPDPIGKPASAYRECLVLIKESLYALAKLI